MARRANHDIHLDLRVRGMGNSATLAINEQSDALRGEGRTIYKMGLGQSPFPVPTVVVEALKLNAHQKDYLPVRGLPSLREVVADYHGRASSLGCDGSDVLIGPGSKELMFLLQLVYYGDLVIPTPSWVSYAPQAHIVGRQVRWLKTRAEDEWRIMPDTLEALGREDATRPRIVILNYPANPTGTTYRSEELKALAKIARQYRMVLLSDEIYGELHHRGRHVSIARYYPEGTIISAGLSKWCGAGGWRLGTFLFPRALRWLLDAMAAVASETYTSTCAPIQYAAVRAFEGGLEVERYLHHSRRVLRALGRALCARLVECGVSVPEPRGAFYLFPDFSPLREVMERKGIHDSPTLCHKLLEERGVALLPGAAFGRPSEELTARLSYVNFDGAHALYASREVPSDRSLDETWLRRNCPLTLEAVEQIAQWVAG
jgi:aspartate aminotransferase